MSYLYHKVIATVKKYNLINDGDSLLIAVSGGPDSVALFRIMRDLADVAGYEIQIFHLNHLIRKEAADDEEFVKNLGDEFKTKVHIKRFDVGDFAGRNGLSLQEGAREVRYNLMEEVAENNSLSKIATGHIKDDVVETFLMRVANGSGLPGLIGIPPKRDNRFIRPLIESSKAEILSWMDEAGQRYVVDRSNDSDKYYRNRIRHHLRPKLIDEKIDDVIFQTCEIIREDESFRENRAYKVFSKIATSKTYGISMPIDKLAKETIDIQSRVLRLCFERLKKIYGSRPTISRLGDALRRIHEDGLKNIDLCGGISISMENDRVVIYLRETDGSIKENKLVIGGANSISLLFNIRVELSDASELNFSGGSDIAYLDESKIKWPLAARSFKPGDRFVPFGMEGTKKVKNFFIDEKIPKRQREHIPIIEDREKIVWIAGYRSDQRVRVNKSDGKVAVLKIETRE